MVLWGFWIDAYFNGLPARVAILLHDTETGYGLAFNLRATLAALFLTPRGSCSCVRRGAATVARSSTGRWG